MCRMASFFLLQALKGSMSGDARDFNNIETRAVIRFFSPCKARRVQHQLPFMVRMGRTDVQISVRKGDIWRPGPSVSAIYCT